MAVPAGCYWGVDSLLPIHKPAGGKASLLEFVRAKAGATPRFWGRYVGSHNKANALSKEEVEYVRTASPLTRILINYNYVRVSGSKADGVADARAAIAAAHAVGVPGGVYIYANAEPDAGSPTAEWILGWWETMHASEYGGRGGLYGNTTGWKGHLEPVYAAALKHVPEGVRPPLWAMHPLKPTTPPDAIAFPYQPNQLKCAPTAAVIWQYSINCYKPGEGKNGLIDMDLATQEGYDGLWKVAQTMSPPTDEELKAMTAGWRD